MPGVGRSPTRSARAAKKFRIVQQTLTWPWAWRRSSIARTCPARTEYYGIADLEPDVLAVNHAINFTMSNLQRIIRFHAHPRPGGGFSANQLKVGVDETIVLPGENAELHNLKCRAT